jgi:PadR family transcriptional regulator
VTCCRSAKVPFILHFTSWNRITAKWQVAETDRRAKFYTLSRAGHRVLEREAANWERLSDAITRVVRLKEV